MRALLFVAALALVACDTTGDDFITAYSGPEITEADATVVDPYGIERRWTADVAAIGSRRSVALEQLTLCGDECGRTISLRFEGPANDLPTSIASVIVQQESLPERRTEESLSIDRVEIQSWGPVYSGIVYPAPQPGASTAPIVFWADQTPYAPD